MSSNAIFTFSPSVTIHPGKILKGRSGSAEVQVLSDGKFTIHFVGAKRVRHYEAAAIEDLPAEVDDTGKLSFTFTLNPENMHVTFACSAVKDLKEFCDHLAKFMSSKRMAEEEDIADAVKRARQRDRATAERFIYQTPNNEKAAKHGHESTMVAASSHPSSGRIVQPTGQNIAVTEAEAKLLRRARRAAQAKAFNERRMQSDNEKTRRQGFSDQRRFERLERKRLRKAKALAEAGMASCSSGAFNQQSSSQPAEVKLDLGPFSQPQLPPISANLQQAASESTDGSF